MKLPAAVVLVAALSLPGQSTNARVIDVSKADCTQFMGLAATDREQIVLWLAGFFAGAAQRPAIDTDQLRVGLKELEALCAKTPGAPLIGQETRPLLFKPAAP